MQNNISSLLVNDFKFPSIKKFFFKKCENLNCKTCLYANTKENILLTDKFILPIFDNNECLSENLIYFIYCNFCNTFYIGQTNNLKKSSWPFSQGHSDD